MNGLLKKTNKRRDENELMHHLIKGWTDRPIWMNEWKNKWNAEQLEKMNIRNEEWMKIIKKITERINI